MDNWYLVYCKPREELRAQQHLANLGFVSYLPLLTKQKIKSGRAILQQEPLFPRYLFLQASTEANLAVVKHTRGVSDFVRFGGKIAAVPMQLIEQLTRLQIEVQREETSKTTFEPGDKLAIMQGPFHGLAGVYQMPDGAGRSLLLIQLLNTTAEVSLPNHVLAKSLLAQPDKF